MVLIGVHRYNANEKVLTEIVSRGENVTPAGKRYQFLNKIYNVGHSIFKKI